MGSISNVYIFMRDLEEFHAIWRREISQFGEESSGNFGVLIFCQYNNNRRVVLWRTTQTYLNDGK